MSNLLTLCTGFLSLAAAAVLAAQPTLTTLYSFGETTNDGREPGYGVSIGAGGVLYGTTAGGGTANAGTVFSLTPPASPGGSWTESVLYNFTNGADGGETSSGVIIGPGGVLYGTTGFGGDFNLGVVYSLTPPSLPGNPWTETVLHSFNGNDGSSPGLGLAMGPGGVLYGTSGGGLGDQGSVFSLAPPSTVNGSWTFTQLFSFFGGAQGQNPSSVPVLGPGGLLYGTTRNGGTGGDVSCDHRADVGCGVVYALSPAGPGQSWNETILFNFDGSTNGRWPADLVMGRRGVLFGGMDGGVYSLAPPASPGGSWTQSILHNFIAIVFGTPYGLVFAPDGTLFGLTEANTNEGGTVFALKPPASPGGAWSEHQLYLFPSGNSQSGPSEPEGLTVSTSGGKLILYGTTFFGPSATLDVGTVFSLRP